MDPGGLSDVGVLVRRSLQGDDAAWSRLVDRYQNLVYSIPRRMGLSPDDAEDVFQATFVAFHRSLDRLDHPATIAKWLSVTASRECFRVKRLNSKHLHEQPEGRSLDELVADEEASADVSAELAVEAETVRSALASISEKCRELLSLLYLASDPSYQEIGEKTGMAVGSIGPTRARCLEKLRSVLAIAGFFDESTYQAPTNSPP